MKYNNLHDLIPAEVREQVYETLRKHCSGYANANEISQQHYSQPSSHVDTPQIFRLSQRYSLEMFLFKGFL